LGVWRLGNKGFSILRKNDLPPFIPPQLYSYLAKFLAIIDFWK
jgi:hypothetical protein